MSATISPALSVDYRVNMNSFVTKAPIMKSLEYENYVVTCDNINRLIKYSIVYSISSIIYGSIMRTFAADLLDIDQNNMPNADLKAILKCNENDSTYTIENSNLRELYNYTMQLKNAFEPLIQRYIDNNFSNNTIADIEFLTAKTLYIHVAFPEIKNHGIWRSCFSFTKTGALCRNEKKISNYIQDICHVIFTKKMNKRVNKIHINIYYNSEHYNKEYLESDENKHINDRIIARAART